MRVISQNGEYNLPYEKVGFRKIDGRIYAMVLGENRQVLMGAYTSEDEAQDVLNTLTTYGHTKMPFFPFPHAPLSRIKES